MNERNHAANRNQTALDTRRTTRNPAIPYLVRIEASVYEHRSHVRVVRRADHGRILADGGEDVPVEDARACRLE